MPLTLPSSPRPPRNLCSRLLGPFFLFAAATACFGQQPAATPAAGLPEAPSSLLASSASAAPSQPAEQLADSSSSSSGISDGYDFFASGQQAGRTQVSGQTGKPNPSQAVDFDAHGDPIPTERQQPKRILGFMPNFRSVSGGAVAHPPGFKYNFTVASRQAFDYSSFLFLGLTSVTAEGMDSHPALGKGVGGFYSYTWRGFLDKTDNTYLSAWLLPSILHEDTRFYALGHGSILKRSLYVISRQAVARTYGGSQTPNIAGLGGKVLTQVVSRYYYPPSAANFSVLATKFGYSAMRDVAFTSIREFYPDIAAHYIRKHRERQQRLLQQQP